MLGSLWVPEHRRERPEQSRAAVQEPGRTTVAAPVLPARHPLARPSGRVRPGERRAAPQPGRGAARHGPRRARAGALRARGGHVRAGLRARPPGATRAFTRSPSPSFLTKPKKEAGGSVRPATRRRARGGATGRVAFRGGVVPERAPAAACWSRRLIRASREEAPLRLEEKENAAALKRKFVAATPEGDDGTADSHARERRGRDRGYPSATETTETPSGEARSSERVSIAAVAIAKYGAPARGFARWSTSAARSCWRHAHGLASSGGRDGSSPMWKVDLGDGPRSRAHGAMPAGRDYIAAYLEQAPGSPT